MSDWDVGTDTFVLTYGKPAITIIKMKVEGDGGNIARIAMDKSAAREMIADLTEAVGDEPNSADAEVELIRVWFERGCPGLDREKAIAFGVFGLLGAVRESIAQCDHRDNKEDEKS